MSDDEDVERNRRRWDAQARLYVSDWGDEGVEFNLPISGWFNLFRSIGWEVVDYLEPRPKAPGLERTHHVTASWGYRYPAEQVWKLRKRGTEPSRDATG